MRKSESIGTLFYVILLSRMGIPIRDTKIVHAAYLAGAASILFK